MALRDKPRPSGYWPNTPNQFREPTVDDCTWYATEFAFEAASKTHLSMHPVNDLRNKSSDRAGGTPLVTALSETYRLWPKSEGVQYRYGEHSKVEIRRALIDGATVVYGGDYIKLPIHYRRWTSNDSFSHAMASRDYRVHNGEGQTFLYDPLGGGPTREPYDGEWISLEALMRFNWDDGSGGEYVGIVYGEGERDKMIKGTIDRKSSKYIELPIGVKVYDAPEGSVVRRTKQRKRYDYFGYASGGWWAIDIWVDGGPVIAYIKKDDSYERGDWPVEPPQPDPEVGALKARIEVLVSALGDISDTADAALNPET